MNARNLSLLALTASLLTALTAAPAVAVEMTVTAMAGLATANGTALAAHQDLETGAVLQTGEGGTCSLLHGENLLVELGPDTKMRIADGSDGGAVIHIQGGQARISTVRKRSDPRVEIRTPSAAVRPMTSTIHVEVDTKTGRTLVTSIEQRALVISIDPAYKRSALLNTNQWVSVPVGDAPGTIQQVDAEAAQKIANAAIAITLRRAAVDDVSRAEGVTMLAGIAADDMPQTAPAAVSAPFQAPSGFAFGKETNQRLESGCDPTSCGAFLVFQDTRPPGPGACGIPGEQCGR